MSADPRIFGVNDVTEQPREEVWSDGRLVQVVRSWMGPRAKVGVIVQKNSAVFANSFRVRYAGRNAAIFAEFDTSTTSSGPTSGVEKVSWELDRPLIDIDIRQAPYFRTAESDAVVRANEFACADRYIETLDAAAWAVNRARLSLPTTRPVWINNYVSDRHHGVDTFKRNYWIVRKIQILSARATQKLLDVNYWTVSTTSPLTGSGISVVNSYLERPKFGVPAQLEWLIVPGMCHEVARRRYQIVTEWWGAEKWAGRYYTGGTG